MSNPVRELAPKSVWNHFEDLNAVPRPSKKEERVIAFMEDFAESLSLAIKKDDTGNLVISKSASSGMENRRPIVMQAHLDMVHQKNSDTEFDFDTQGIQSYIDGEWVKAKGTTLGADNGMGVAAIMAVLSSTDVAHPAIEALFTVDEEAGMTGAQNLKPGWLKGEILLNLDTEEDDELSIGCAGGVDINIDADFNAAMDRDRVEGVFQNAYEIKVSGLSGGHSGMDIHRGRGNANKIMNRLMLSIPKDQNLQIISIDGGSLRNAIPRESNARIIVNASLEIFEKLFKEEVDKIKIEFAETDPDLAISLENLQSTPIDDQCIKGDVVESLLKALDECHNGVKRMSADVEGLVETSNNLARVDFINGVLSVKCLTRSDQEQPKMELAQEIKKAFESVGPFVKVEFSGAYPGWKLDPKAPMLGMMKDLYKDLFKEEPSVLACHAGLECGLLGKHYPDMEMISFGPTIRGAHSPDERVNIKSVDKFWGYLQEALKRIPVKS